MGKYIIGSKDVVKSPVGSGNTIVKDATGDFSPVNSSNVEFLIDSVSDVTVTINIDSCSVGQCIEFTQEGVGQVLLAQGDATFEADVYTSFKTAAQYSTIGVFHKREGVYRVYGQTE